MSDEYDRLLELAAAATPGPWIRTWASFDVHAMTDDDVLRHQADIDFAVALVNAYPSLVAAVRERDELRAALETAGYRFDSIGAHLKPDATDEDRDQVAIDWWFGSEEVRAALHREDGAS